MSSASSTSSSTSSGLLRPVTQPPTLDSEKGREIIDENEEKILVNYNFKKTCK